MPIVNFTIPDSAPFITYSPAAAWGDSDAATQYYTNGTFHFTQTPGASASFKFNGSAAYIYGALRGNHDEYTVSLDGKNTTANGHTDNTVGVFNVSLFGANSLGSGEHTISLINTPSAPTGKYVDIDWAVITVGDGDASSPGQDIWVDDSATGNWTYSDGWAASKNGLSPQYYNQTFYATNKPGATATLKFSGNAVAVYGASSSNHGGYKVSLDGLPEQTFNGSQKTFRAQQLLYYASSLPAGAHSLTLTNVDALYTDLDYAVVSRWGSGANSSASGPPSASSTTTSSTSASVSLPAPFSTSTTAVVTGTGTGTTNTSSPNPSTTASAAAARTPGVSKVGVFAIVSTLALGVLSSFSVL